MIATLPLLKFEDLPPLEMEDLYYSCRDNIREDDLELVQSASLEPGENLDCEVLGQWYTWERSLRNELVRLRSQKLGEESDRFLREGEIVPGLSETAREAFSQDSPLEAENILDRARWLKLEELEVGHYFDLVKLVIYTLKLKLLKRRSFFREESGREMFEEIYGHIREDIQNAE
jgi:hypothetical protein